MAKGVDWKVAQAKSLNAHNQKLYAEYASKVAEAQELATTLKDAANKEWEKKYPNGKDGQVCIFNAINGVLLFAFKPLDKVAKKTAKAFDLDKGESPF